AEGRARRAMMQLFGEYVSPALVEQMARDPVNYRIAGSANCELTILFADIRGFTRIAETMEPEALREYLNTFLTGMTGIVHAHRGTVDKYMGDAVMAFWGAPVDDAAHADNAVAAALAMQAEVLRMSEALRARGLPPLAVGIGINTGIVRVGDMGSKLRRAYTVIGDAVNLASRLEGLTKQYEVPIIAGEGTVRRCRQHAFVELARATVAGRAESVRIFVPKAVVGSDADRGADTVPMRVRAEAPGNAREALHEGTSPGM
ncbi:MAG: adenylate/guanylate cyclase domain-containing protein, partial [Burkholderiaceae bacterium]|nr:adenylate/guanylate cyclase domain-containing protein [Burkholderiaceae bacterium]